MTQKSEQWIEELLKLSDTDDKVTDKQVRILQAAVEMFSEKGYSATSTSEIAQKAGVAEGTIFRHYKTKKELLLSIVAPVMTKFIAPVVLRDFHKVLDMPYPHYEDFLRAVLRNRFDFAKKHVPILKIMLQEIPFHAELREPFLEQVGKQVYDRLQKAVDHFQKQGEIIELPVASVIRMTVTVMIGFLITRFLLLPNAQWEDDAEIEQTIRFILYGLSPARPE